MVYVYTVSFLCPLFLLSCSYEFGLLPPNLNSITASVTLHLLIQM